MDKPLFRKPENRPDVKCDLCGELFHWATVRTVPEGGKAACIGCHPNWNGGKQPGRAGLR